MNQSESRNQANPDQFVSVNIGGQRFGIPVGDVQDVFTPELITRVPLAPPEIAGVLNLRGRIVTVIDIRKRLGLVSASGEAPAMAIGIESNGESYGLVIDEVGEVLNLDPSLFEPLPDTLDAKWRAVSKGVYHLQDSLIVVLDVGRLIGVERSQSAA